MPEGPEVQVIVNDLTHLVLGKKLLSIMVIDNTLYNSTFSRRSLETIKNENITKIERVGKYIVFHLNKKVLAIHLRMTGSLVKSKNKHTRAILKIENYTLYFNNVRRFGTFEIFDSVIDLKAKKNLGKDILDIGVEEFINVISNAKSSIFSALLTSRYITGIGNIYANEILHCSKVNPNAKVKNMSKSKLYQIHNNAQKILKKSITYRGTSFSDYIDLKGNQGKYQTLLKVYNKHDRLCLYCSNRIKKDKVNGRTIFYCSRCQPF